MGIIVIIIGLYIFFTMGFLDTRMMPNAFYVMFFGFSLSVVGGVHGRRMIKSHRLRSQLQIRKNGKESGEVLEEVEEELEELEENIMEKKPKKKETVEEEMEELEEGMLKKKPKMKIRPKASKAPTKPLPRIMPRPSAPKIEPDDKVIKMILCSHCGEGNKYTAKFCDKCGKMLKKVETTGV